MEETTGTERDRVGTCTLYESDWNKVYNALQAAEENYKFLASDYHYGDQAIYTKLINYAHDIFNVRDRLVQNIKYETP